MRIFFTGATSLAGRTLFSQLREAGHHVHGISRNPLPAPSTQIDLTSPDLEAELPDDSFDTLIHFASYVPENEKESDWATCYERNVRSLSSLFKWGAGRFRKVILASSLAVYGTPQATLPVTEDYPLHPDTAYALSKYAQEMLFSAFCVIERIPLVTLRLGYVYGPGIPSSRGIVKLARMVDRGEPVTLTNSETAGLHLIHVDDIARIATHFLHEGHGTYNLAPNRHISLLEFIRTAMIVAGKTVPLTCKDDPAAPFTNHYSCGKLIREQRIEPVVPLADGIADLLSEVQS